MATEKSIIYWIGQEPTGPGHSPTLDQMPASVDIVPLAFCGIGPKNNLTYGLLTEKNSADTIKGWIKTVRANGTKVVLSVLSTGFETVDPQQFAQNVQQAITEWGVDGLDIDYEPPTRDQDKQQRVVKVVQTLRQVLGSEVLLMAPIYGNWLGSKSFLHDFAAPLDLVTTMDYTPYPRLDGTEYLFGQYAQAIGSSEKLAIGVSCMDGPKSPSPQNFTPLDDVIALCKWEPQNGSKAGVMLYTFSYDLKVRILHPKDKPSYDSGTGYPDGTWTKTILENLP